MISTFCLNPSFDKTVEVSAFRTGGTNRILRSRVDPGGKGVNVARVLKTLGMDVHCVCALPDKGKEEFLELLSEENLEVEAISTPGTLRTNTKIFSQDSSRVTELNESGVPLSSKALEDLAEKEAELKNCCDMHVLSGSLPPHASEAMYYNMIQTLSPSPVFLDASGKALLEGIMMRGPKRTTVACRIDKDHIYTEDIEVKPLFKAKFWKLPLIRGLAGMIDSMRLSYKALGLSADKAMEAGLVEEEEPSKFEKGLDEKLGDKLMNVVMVIASVLGIALALGLFVFLPAALFDWTLGGLFKTVDPATQAETYTVAGQIVKSAFCGVLKIALFIGYMLLVSQMNDMKRVFKYHGAEHKTIFCYENDEELTVENVRKQTRFHPRCGTSFLVVTLLVSIFVGFTAM